MARPTRRLIAALHVTIERIESGSRYQWGNMGSCNCGHLAQTLTQRSRAEIHAAALMRAGDWGEQSVEYCATSGLPLDHLIEMMLDAGLDREDLYHLERLDDPSVLARLPRERRWLSRNSRTDALIYMREWTAALTEELRALEGDQVAGLSIEALVEQLRAQDPELRAHLATDAPSDAEAVA